MIVNGGERIEPSLIDLVQDRHGKSIWSAADRPCGGCSKIGWRHQAVPVIADNREHLADPGSVYQLVTMMQGVVERGTGIAVRAVGKPLAGKTGTTNDFRDAWFVGFSPDLAAGVYVGYDEPDSLGMDETGGHVAAPIFRDFMTTALEHTPAVDFRIPPGLRLYRVSAASGLPVSGKHPAIYEAYKPGTEPGAIGQLHQPREEHAPVLTQQELPPPHPAPAGGTGGLY
jgi:penicillin-binding protein 1A